MSLKFGVFQLWHIGSLREACRLNGTGKGNHGEKAQGKGKCRAGKEGGGKKGASKASNYTRIVQRLKPMNRSWTVLQMWACRAQSGRAHSVMWE